ncbi:hypothetical protein OROMI_003138 [Orobanche minor]
MLPKSQNAPIRGTKTGTGYVSVPGTRYGRGRLLQIAKLERNSLIRNGEHLKIHF